MEGMNIATKFNLELVSIVNKENSTMQISVYHENFWHSVSQGFIFVNLEGKLICIQTTESSMINKDITDSKIDISLINNKKIDLSVKGRLERFVVNEDEFQEYRKDIKKLFPNVILFNILIIEPYEIVSDNYIFRTEVKNKEVLSVRIDKAV